MVDASLRSVLDDVPAAYAYSYPHKSSYRTFSPAIPLHELWAQEETGRLSLYVHVPFCEMRCGFCNLFTQSQPGVESVTAYLETLARQCQVMARTLHQPGFSQFAMGGGTPTFLLPQQLDRVFDAVEENLAVSISQIGGSVETSPATADADRLRLLARRGIDRISIGVQSFDDADAGRMGRPQSGSSVHAALDRIRGLPFRILNIDLIYGGETQSISNLESSLHAALQYRPEELYLYPLYIRPDTGLARRGHQPIAHRSDLYRAARDLLLDAGYEQHSMRCFRSVACGPADHADYRCQADGMVGLGCGARSYTNSVHYASRFAVTQAGVRAILGDWISQSDDDLGSATHGIELTAEERRRRFVILSLLHRDGLDEQQYRRLFGTAASADFPELQRLGDEEYVERLGDCLRLTPLGMEWSDRIGPFLYSPVVRQRLEEFTR